jgi:hypothetical protein
MAERAREAQQKGALRGPRPFSATGRAVALATDDVCDVGDWIYRFGLAADRQGPPESACHPRLPDISLLPSRGINGASLTWARLRLMRSGPEAAIAQATA